jgi:diamine N-acetyltransferase
VLTGERIRLTPLASSDLEPLLEWTRDRDLMLMNAPYSPISEAQHRDWFDAIQRRSDVVCFAIRLKESQGIVGSCQLHSISAVHRSADLQIRMGDAEHRDRGLGSEALELLVSFGFDDLNLRRIGLHVLADNAKAIHVYEKIGFVREGVWRSAAYIAGRYVDVVLMGLLDTERPRPAGPAPGQ